MIRLLIVDDDYLITTALKTILEAEGDLSVCASEKTEMMLSDYISSFSPISFSWISAWNIWTD